MRAARSLEVLLGLVAHTSGLGWGAYLVPLCRRLPPKTGWWWLWHHHHGWSSQCQWWWISPFPGADWSPPLWGVSHSLGGPRGHSWRTETLVRSTVARTEGFPSHTRGRLMEPGKILDWGMAKWWSTEVSCHNHQPSNPPWVLFHHPPLYLKTYSVKTFHLRQGVLCKVVRTALCFFILCVSQSHQIHLPKNDQVPYIISLLNKPSPLVDQSNHINTCHVRPPVVFHTHTAASGLSSGPSAWTKCPLHAMGQAQAAWLPITISLVWQTQADHDSRASCSFSSDSCDLHGLQHPSLGTLVSKLCGQKFAWK